MSEIPATKKCKKCSQEKELSEFHNSPRGKYGKKARCKKCVIEHVLKYYDNHREEQIENMGVWKEKNRDHYNEYQNQYQKSRRLKAKESPAGQ